MRAYGTTYVQQYEAISNKKSIAGRTNNSRYCAAVHRVVKNASPTGNAETIFSMTVDHMSGTGSYAGIMRSHFDGTPSGHGPGRRQVRHVHILQIGLHLTQPLSARAAPRIPARLDPIGGILRRKSRQMPLEA